MMGELAAFVTIYESMLLAHETVAPIKDGVLWPSTVTLYSAMAMQSEFNGRMLEMVRELAGGAFITLPSSLADIESPQTAPDVERYMRSASTDAKSKITLMRLIWDFIGSEFGSRHQQYEKFYGGASFLVKTNVYPQLRLEARRRAGRQRAQPAAAGGDRLTSDPDAIR